MVLKTGRYWQLEMAIDRKTEHDKYIAEISKTRDTKRHRMLVWLRQSKLSW